MTATVATLGKSGNRPLIGAGVGTFIEFYDFTIYALTVPVIAAQFFPKGNQGVAVIAAFAVYGVAFVVRPLGGIVFGPIGDRYGRRRVLTLVLTLIGLATALIGVLPTYSTIGVLAPLALVALRLLQGLSAGGEVISATSFAMEHAPPNRRSMWISTVVATSALSAIAGTLVILGLTAAIPSAAFGSWGWRLPFLIALPLSLIGVYIRLRTDESPVFEQAQQADALSSTPVRESVRRNGKSIVLAFALAAMSNLGFYYMAGYFPTYLQVTAGLSRTSALLANGVGLAAFAVSIPLFGLLADRYGRRLAVRLGAGLLAVVSVPAFLLAGSGGMVGAVIGPLLLTVSLAVFGGGSFAAVLELFPTRTRLSGAAVGYNLGTLLGGTAPLVASTLVQTTGNPTAPGYYVASIAVLVLIVALFIPETRKVDINA